MFVYILHFDTKLSHAQHYVGSTTNLKYRLKAHALGFAANLTKVIAGHGIGWQLATLLKVERGNFRAIERLIKKQNNGPRYCKICTKQAPVPKGCRSYDLRILTREDVAITSHEILQEGKDGIPDAKRNN